jgi:hypothetical protein
MTCNHPPCTCPTTDGAYCSPQCAGAVGNDCACNHQGCAHLPARTGRAPQ